MAIRKWHSGKLIILWAWGSIAVALALTGFLSSPVKDAPAQHLVEVYFRPTGPFRTFPPSLGIGLAEESPTESDSVVAIRRVPCLCSGG